MVNLFCRAGLKLFLRSVTRGRAVLKRVMRKSGQSLFLLSLCSGLLALFLTACESEVPLQPAPNASEQLFESYDLPPQPEEFFLTEGDDFFSPFAIWQQEREQANLSSALPEISGLPEYLNLPEFSEIADEFSLDLSEEIKAEEPQALPEDLFEFETVRPKQPE